jgi:hypothetical protein
MFHMSSDTHIATSKFVWKWVMTGTEPVSHRVTQAHYKSQINTIIFLAKLDSSRHWYHHQGMDNRCSQQLDPACRR